MDQSDKSSRLTRPNKLCTPPSLSSDSRINVSEWHTHHETAYMKILLIILTHLSCLRVFSQSWKPTNRYERYSILTQTLTLITPTSQHCGCQPLDPDAGGLCRISDRVFNLESLLCESNRNTNVLPSIQGIDPQISHGESHDTRGSPQVLS